MEGSSTAARFEPKNPEFAARCRESFGRQAFMTFLGATMEVIEPGYCEIHQPYRPELTQQHGFVHGGVLATLADTVAGYAAFSLMPADSAPLTVEYKLNILRPGGGDKLIAKGKVLKPGRSLSVVQADVYNVEDGSEVQSLASLQTLIVMQGWDDSARR